jgi:TPR repeat protein
LEAKVQAEPIANSAQQQQNNQLSELISQEFIDANQTKSPQELFNIGLNHELGIGVDIKHIDLCEAVKYFHLAASLHSSDALYRLGMLCLFVCCLFIYLFISLFVCLLLNDSLFSEGVKSAWHRGREAYQTEDGMHALRYFHLIFRILEHYEADWGCVLGRFH